MERIENNLNKNERVHGLTAFIGVIAVILLLGVGIAIVIRAMLG